jgi:hypothetical protein
MFCGDVVYICVPFRDGKHDLRERVFICADPEYGIADEDRMACVVRQSTIIEFYPYGMLRRVPAEAVQLAEDMAARGAMPELSTPVGLLDAVKRYRATLLPAK